MIIIIEVISMKRITKKKWPKRLKKLGNEMIELNILSFLLILD